MDPAIWDCVANADPAVRGTIEKHIMPQPLFPPSSSSLPALARPCPPLTALARPCPQLPTRKHAHARPRLGTDLFFFCFDSGAVCFFFFRCAPVCATGEKSWCAT